MGIIDHGTSGQTLAAPSLAAWAASVAAVLDNSDTPISARLPAAVSYGTTAGTATEGNDARIGKINGVAVTGTPTAGQVPVATSGTAAAWATPSGGGGSSSLSGSGSPVGVVTPASVGLIYADTAITLGVRLWVSTGTTNTSWKVIRGDTGLRLVTISGIVTTNGVPRDLRVQRVDDLVYLTINQVQPSSTADTDVYNLPSGFRPAAWMNVAPLNDKGWPGGTTTLAFCKVAIGPASASSPVRFIGHTNVDLYSLVCSWVTSDPWPTSLPGSAA